jgi:hypothetical protein
MEKEPERDETEDVYDQVFPKRPFSRCFFPWRNEDRSHDGSIGGRDEERERGLSLSLQKGA